MKFERLPTRRTHVRKTLSARIFNTTKTKRQRASAAAASSDDIEDSGINISRSLTIIFAIHILAIGMIFIHKQYLSDRTPAPVVTAEKTTGEATLQAPAPVSTARKFSNGDTPYMVEKGDNFTIIAKNLEVDEAELRNLNRGREMRAGTVLSIPHSRRIVAEDPPEVAAIRNQPGYSDSERGLVEIAPPISNNPARLIRPVTREQLEDAPRASVVGSGRTHILKSGENIWRIATKYQVSQKDLMALNNITDPSKLQIGQVIKLP